jgi:hypothetical protein
MSFWLAGLDCNITEYVGYIDWLGWNRGFGIWIDCLNFRHRASCILGQAFHFSPENAF